MMARWVWALPIVRIPARGGGGGVGVISSFAKSKAKKVFDSLDEIICERCAILWRNSARNGEGRRAYFQEISGNVRLSIGPEHHIKTYYDSDESQSDSEKNFALV